ncbi:DUF3306 domain-containing protein [Rubritepida flocculans]|uniref:DUF3306 domain-containing protein n=1 Tax=Rubritepida flocculans TaxID=182403 RepID=UPI0004050C54|nr:DUF3306 domain-containing protein [Rubritepida flocculans]
MPSEGFLSRWSRRKQAFARGEGPAEPAPEPPPAAAPGLVPPPEPAAPPPAPAVEAAAPAEAEPEFDLSSLPDIETITAATDIRVFFHKAVPEALRQAALRKAWATDPVISTYMGPLDYAWDFNTPGGLPYGFASELGEVGEKLRELIAQAIGEPPARPDSEAEAEPGSPPAALAEAADAPPADEAAPLEAPPSPLRLAQDAPAEDSPPSPAPEAPAEPPPPRRRHGGALPV